MMTGILSTGGKNEDKTESFYFAGYCFTLAWF